MLMFGNRGSSVPQTKLNGNNTAVAPRLELFQLAPSVSPPRSRTLTHSTRPLAHNLHHFSCAKLLEQRSTPSYTCLPSSEAFRESYQLRPTPQQRCKEICSRLPRGSSGATHHRPDSMTQPDGLSPRASRQQPQQSTSSACVTPTSCSTPGRFFEQDQHQQSTAGAMLKPKRPRSPRPTRQTKATSTKPLISQQQLHHHSGNRASSRVLAIIAAVAVIIPLLYVRGSGRGAEPTGSRTRPSLRALSSAGAQHRCDVRRSWGGVASKSRAQCAGVLPSSVVDGQGWLVAVHVDRTPAMIKSPAAGKKRLRGSAHHRCVCLCIIHVFFAVFFYFSLFYTINTAVVLTWS